MAEKPGVAIARLLRPGLGRVGEEAEVARGARDIVIDAFADRFADVTRLERSQVARAPLDAVGHALEDAAARLGAHPRPWSAIGGLARRGHGALDIVASGIRHPGQLSLGGRLDVGEARAARGCDIPARDEQIGFNHERRLLRAIADYN